MPHEIHTSERRSFRGCRRRWDWAYREGYVPITPIKALEFGIAYHAGLQSFYEPTTWSTTTPQEKIANAIEAFVAECEKQKLNYLKSFEIRKLPEDVAIDYDERLELGKGMLTYYGTFVHPKFDNWFKPIAVEIPFSVPIMDLDNYDGDGFIHCTNSPACGQTHSNDINDPDSRVVYSGRVDMLVEDIRFGGYFIWDHKSAGQLAKDDGFLQLDDQIASYCWALLLILGLDIKGFIYAESRKDYPRIPKELKRLSGGRSFSTAQNQATSIEIFEPFVAMHDRLAYESGAYDAYIAFLKSEDATLFSQRFNILKSEAELNNVGKNIALEAADMVDSKTRIYPSVGRYTCSTCAYRQPCLSEFMDEDTTFLFESNYIQTDRRYWMDQPISSDKGSK